MQVPVKMRDMTHSHGRHDSLKSATGLSDGADRSESWDGECASGARRDSERDKTYVTCATRIIMDHLHVRHDSCHVSLRVRRGT